MNILVSRRQKPPKDADGGHDAQRIKRVEPSDRAAVYHSGRDHRQKGRAAVLGTGSRRRAPTRRCPPAKGLPKLFRTIDLANRLTTAMQAAGRKGRI